MHVLIARLVSCRRLRGSCPLPFLPPPPPCLCVPCLVLVVLRPASCLPCVFLAHSLHLRQSPIPLISPTPSPPFPTFPTIPLLLRSLTRAPLCLLPRPTSFAPSSPLRLHHTSTMAPQKEKVAILGSGNWYASPNISPELTPSQGLGHRKDRWHQRPQA